MTNREWLLDKLFLIATGMVLRRHENQPRTRLRRPHLRRPSASLENADHCRISREHANSNGEHYCEAENQRHEERNHDQTTFTRLR